MSFTPGGLLRRFFGSAISNAAGYAIGGAITPTLEPLTQDLANEAWTAHPVKPLSAAASAEAVVRDLWDEGRAGEEAQRTGIDGERFDVLHGLAGEPPGPQQLLELWNRDQLTEARVDTGLRQSRMRPEWYTAFKTLRDVLVPVSDLVRFAVREVFSPADRARLDLDAEFPAAFAEQARKLGLPEQSARDYWAAHWDLPSYTQATEMLFRGEISRAEFNGLLKALDYAPTWRGPLEAIARRIPTITDMIRFAVREVYNPPLRKQLGIDAEYPAAFTAAAAMHGMAEADARDYWAAHWRLPSARQGYQMLWRGEITAGELDALLKSLDYPPVWRDRLANIAHLVPGRVDLRRMYKADVITRAEVHAGYVRLGYTDADAETLTKFADTEKAGGSTAKHETAAELRDEFEGGYITEAEFRTQLATLGYDPADVDMLVSLGDARRVKTERARVVTALHKMFSKGDIDATRATGLLTDTGMHAEAVARVIALWTLERDAQV